MGSKQVFVLECTLRDGGLAIEDEARYNESVKRFGGKESSEIAQHLACSNVDFVELGSVEISDEDKTGFAIYNSIEAVSCAKPNVETASQFVALFRGPDTPIKNIPRYEDSLCESVRVIIRYSEIEKSMSFCAALAQKGYKVFVQPMLTLRYTDDELDYILKASKDLNAFAVYFVDSYGYMIADDVKRFYDKYDSILDPAIQIGFHPHNNMNLAFANTIEFIDHCYKSGDRRIIIDSTCLGMGQGAGNLQTELLVAYLNDNYGTTYNYDAILDVCEMVEMHTSQSLWGYSVARVLSASNKVAYKYAVALRRTYSLKYKEIHRIFRDMPDELRHRYTPQSTKELLELFGYKDIL